jgi:puromycin-sensitive aminopeptidase
VGSTSRAKSKSEAPDSFRLPKEVRPEHYQLSIDVDPTRARSYHGSVRIELRLKRAAPSIELHAVDLKITAAWFQVGSTRVRAEVLLVPEHETVRLLPATRLGKGALSLQLDFVGHLRDDLRGLYFASRNDNHYAVSQLEAADARRFFPCFDEPAFKARFSIDVTTAASHAVISNGPEVSSERLPRGRKRVHFAPTPLLSTYLVALAVGNLRASPPVLAGKTPIRIWHVPGQSKLTEFGLVAARECLLRLQQYFGVPYPYAKLDLVAVPDFEAGAMENAGAVFFRETLLLVDERRATLREKKRAIEVICHELAHMWYGNLVTMAWWDDLWLNEAFATWMAFEIVDRWRPELRMWNDFGHSRSSALSLDALDSTHPIYTEVYNAAQATENFDLITYEKGAAVIRMLERYLGPARFRRGVRDYIREHREGNATAADLWRALERHAGQKVATVVRPWIERAGFPLLRVGRRSANKRTSKTLAPTLTLEQERFTAKGPNATPSAEPWPMPVVVKIGPARAGRSIRTLVGTARGKLALPKGARFVYANADEGGFYRPLHDRALLDDIIRHIDQLATAERLGLIGHTWALVHAGYSPIDDLLDLTCALGAETDPDVLAALYAPLWQVLDRVAAGESSGVGKRQRNGRNARSARGAHREPTALQASLRATIAATFGPAWNERGFAHARGESQEARLRRAELLRLVALLAEDEATVRSAEEHLERYLDAPNSLEANMVGPVIIVGARSGGLARHTRYLEGSERAPTPQERLRFRMALAEFRDPACIEQTLLLCRGPRIPTQDIPLIFARMFDNPAAREPAWKFVQRRWKELRRRIPPMLASRLIDATPALQSRVPAREVMEFFQHNPLPTAERAQRQASERFTLDAALRKRATPALASWLASRSSSTRGRGA